MSVNNVMRDALKAEKVKYVFGIYGSFYDELIDDPDIKGIEIRYEGSAPFMASGYARMSGKIGACAGGGSGGTGLSNMVSGVLEAYSNCSPIFIHTSSPSKEINGMGAFAECENTELMKTITKWSASVLRPERMPWYMHRALSIATNGRPGPVFLEVPGDVGSAEVEMPKYNPIISLKTRGDAKGMRDAVDLLVKAERPIVVAGGGIILSRAFESFKDFVEMLGIPFFTTPQGRSILPEDHPLAMGLCGIYTSKFSKKVYDEADLILTIGSRMEAFQSVEFRYFPQEAKFIQVDIEPFSIGLNWMPDVAIVGDADLVLKDLIRGLHEKLKKRDFKGMPRIQEMLKAKKEYENEVDSECKSESIPISSKRVVREMNEVFGKNTILSNENGHNDVWSYIYPFYKVLDSWCTVPMGEQTCFGSGIAGAIGAKLARPDMNVICPTGDGAFQHYNMELATAAQYKLGITWVVLNNFGFGRPGQFKVQPDFEKLAEASECYGVRVERPSELKMALENSLKANKEGIPAVVNVIIEHNPAWGPWGAWGSGARKIPRSVPL